MCCDLRIRIRGKMKTFLYLAVMSLFIARTRQLSNEYNLMPFSLMDTSIPTDDSSGDAFTALDFSSSHQKIAVKDLHISRIVKAPYILQTVFKLYEANTYFLFSLEDKDRKPQLAVKFSQGERNVMRISLSLKETDDDVVFQMNNLVNEWNDLLFHVEDNKVSLHWNCSFIESQENNNDKTLLFEEDSNLILGKAEIYDVERNFAGAIETIKIITDVDDSTIDTRLCNYDSVLHRLTHDYADTDDDIFAVGDLPPENLTLDRGDGGRDTEPDLGKDAPDSVIKGEKGDTGKPGVQGEKGLKGEKGEKGYAGIKGEPGESIKGQPGIEGPSGPPGIGLPGKRGDQGKCECSEKLVSTLIRTMPELKGPAGDAGPRGEEGPQGEPGKTGKPGPQGERGPEGLRGETGERGSNGRPGNDGVPGQKGEPGKDGRPGEQGLQGLVGPPGPPGPVYVETEEEKKSKQVFIPGVKGDTGPEGPPGPIGPRGYKGDMGEKGERGLTGEHGEQGPKGSVGPRGEKGERGDEGDDGLPGSPGNHGKPGERGEKGDRGDKGSPGLAGLPAKLTDLLDTDIDPFENMQIVEKLRGLKGDAGINGDKGAKGDHGLDGVPGTPGKDGHDGKMGPIGPVGPKGDTGPMGPRGHKGAQGEPGPPGLVPAEDIALMKGSKGVRGVPGVKGPHGPRGATGPTGSKGNKGDTGPRGPLGPMGPTGMNGTHGMKGEKGECAIPNNFEKVKGDKGERGEAGIPGKDGNPGPPGPRTDEIKGSTGEPGPPGPPGPPGLSISGPKGEPGTFYSFSGGFMHDDDDSYTTNTVIFKSRTALIKRTLSTPVGTLAYVLQEEILLVRVQSGWRHVEMGSIFPPIESTTHVRPYPIISSTSRPIRERPGSKYIRLAALNDPYTGKVHDRMRSGLSAADYECNQQSLRAGLGGNFRAFLTNKIQNAISIVASNERDLPVKNLHGELLFYSWNSIFDGSGGDFDHPINIYSFDGRNVMIDSKWPKKVVWHGSDEKGVRLPQSFCNEWDDESNYTRGMASSLYDRRLLGQKKYTCDNKLIVLCVEVSAAEQRRTRHYSGRRNSYNHRPPYRNEIGRP